MRPWALVTPASRGIGLALTQRLLQTTALPVVATARTDPADTKQRILGDLPGVDADRLTVLSLDVTDEATISAAASHVSRLFPPASHTLHVALVVPGILHPEKSPAQIERDKALRTFEVNTLGPMLLMKHFVGFLPTKRGGRGGAGSAGVEAAYDGLNERAVWATMSARVGSVSDNRLGGWYSYRASKAGVNQLVKTFDLHLQGSAGPRAVSIGLHPGTVKTGLSRDFWASVKREKLFSSEFAAERLLSVVAGLGEEQRGRVWDWEGKEVVP